MKHIQDGYTGLSFFLQLQIDRILSVGLIAMAVLLASYLGQL